MSMQHHEEDMALRTTRFAPLGDSRRAERVSFSDAIILWRGFHWQYSVRIDRLRCALGLVAADEKI